MITGFHMQEIEELKFDFLSMWNKLSCCSLKIRNTNSTWKPVTVYACQGPPCTPLEPIGDSVSLRKSLPCRLGVSWSTTCYTTGCFLWSCPQSRLFAREMLCRCVWLDLTDAGTPSGSLWRPIYLSCRSVFCISREYGWKQP